MEELVVDVTLEELVEDDLAKADAAKAVNVRMKGRIIMRDTSGPVVLEVGLRDSR